MGNEACPLRRIALVVARYEPGVTVGSRHVEGLAASLLDRGHAVELFVGRALDRSLLALFRRDDVDLIHLHGPPWPLLPLPALVPRAGAAVVATVHAPLPATVAPRTVAYLQRCLDVLDGVIATAPAIVIAHQARGLRFRASVLADGVDERGWSEVTPRLEEAYARAITHGLARTQGLRATA